MTSLNLEWNRTKTDAHHFACCYNTILSVGYVAMVTYEFCCRKRLSVSVTDGGRVLIFVLQWCRTQREPRSVDVSAPGTSWRTQDELNYEKTNWYTFLHLLSNLEKTYICEVTASNVARFTINININKLPLNSPRNLGIILATGQDHSCQTY